MTEKANPTDLELAALISSKICHDVIGPVGAINNGLEILDEDESIESQKYALDVIKNVTEQASARLQFARFAFGAAGSAGAAVELDTARDLAMAFVTSRKHELRWTGPNELMGKHLVKLLLNLVACSVTALPRGGTIDVEITGAVSTPTFRLTCQGRGARRPNFLSELVDGEGLDEVDTMSIQAYYTWRLAEQSDMNLMIEADDETVTLTAALPS